MSSGAPQTDLSSSNHDAQPQGAGRGGESGRVFELHKSTQWCLFINAALKHAPGSSTSRHASRRMERWQRKEEELRYDSQGRWQQARHSKVGGEQSDRWTCGGADGDGEWGVDGLMVEERKSLGTWDPLRCKEGKRAIRVGDEKIELREGNQPEEARDVTESEFTQQAGTLVVYPRHHVCFITPKEEWQLSQRVSSAATGYVTLKKATLWEKKSLPEGLPFGKKTLFVALILW